MTDKILQQGVLSPFRRDKKRDFASGSGAAILRTKVTQVLMTDGTTPQSSGELPWRTEFGAGLSLLRHQRNDATLQELARVYIRDALRRWLPGVELISLEVNSRENVLDLRVGVRESTTVTDVFVEVER